jgi:1-acyl-sn-glycerol-3-phosphate acyltransferase
MTRRRGSLTTTLRAARVTVHMLQGLATTLVVFPLATEDRRRNLIRRWSDKLLRLLRIEARVDGALDVAPGNLLVVANHVSWLDIFVLNAQHPLRFVAKAELARWPLAGRLIRDAGTIFVARERRHDTKRVNRYAAQALSRGDVVAVFPEGTTTDGTTLLRFHASLLQPVVDSHGRVQPVALRYLDLDDDPTTAAVYGDETFVASFWRICGEPGLRVDVRVADPIAARDRHRRELAREAEHVIRRSLGLVATVPGTGDDREATSR